METAEAAHAWFSQELSGTREAYREITSLDNNPELVDGMLLPRKSERQAVNPDSAQTAAAANMMTPLSGPSNNNSTIGWHYS